MNRRLQSKIIHDECVDVSGCPREGAYYVLDRVIDGMDYADGKTNRHIWSIGRRHSDGVILASTAADLYQNPEFHCLWLR